MSWGPVALSIAASTEAPPAGLPSLERRRCCFFMRYMTRRWPWSLRARYQAGVLARRLYSLLQSSASSFVLTLFFCDFADSTRPQTAWRQSRSTKLKDWDLPSLPGMFAGNLVRMYSASDLLLSPRAAGTCASSLLSSELT